MPLLVTSVVVVFIDWSSKALASVSLDERSIEVGSMMILRLSHNPGVAFGLGNRMPSAIVIGVTAAVTILLAVAALRGAFPSPGAAGLVLGGGIANLGDRVVGGSVVDLLDLGWWPSFNLADVALTVGCGLLLVLSWREPPGSAS